jgi:hypothetical protein
MIRLSVSDASWIEIMKRFGLFVKNDSNNQLYSFLR